MGGGANNFCRQDRTGCYSHVYTVEDEPPATLKKNHLFFLLSPGHSWENAFRDGKEGYAQSA